MTSNQLRDLNSGGLQLIKILTWLYVTNVRICFRFTSACIWSLPSAGYRFGKKNFP